MNMNPSIQMYGIPLAKPTPLIGPNHSPYRRLFPLSDTQKGLPTSPPPLSVSNKTNKKKKNYRIELSQLRPDRTHPLPPPNPNPNPSFHSLQTLVLHNLLLFIHQPCSNPTLVLPLRPPQHFLQEPPILRLRSRLQSLVPPPFLILLPFPYSHFLLCRLPWLPLLHRTYLFLLPNPPSPP